MTDATYAWVDALETDAPDIVAAWNGIEEGTSNEVRCEIRARVGVGSADLMHLEQLHDLARVIERTA